MHIFRNPIESQVKHLLTESKLPTSDLTAEEFFDRLGYTKTDRESAPATIRQTEEFSGLCPSSSAFMVKVIMPLQQAGSPR